MGNLKLGQDVAKTAAHIVAMSYYLKQATVLFLT